MSHNACILLYAGRSRTETFEIAEYKESPKLQNSISNRNSYYDQSEFFCIIELVASFSASPADCMCQVFYHKTSLNCWRIVFAFFPKGQLDVRFYLVT